MVDSVAGNIVPVFVDIGLSSLGRYLRGELLGQMVAYVELLKKMLTFFQRGSTILRSHQKCMRVPLSPPPSTLVIVCLFSNSQLATCSSQLGPP